MDEHLEGKQVYEWKYDKKEILTSHEFLKKILQKLETKDILSVGEHHDTNRDKSFERIADYSYDILTVYDWYRHFTQQDPSKKTPEFERLLPRESGLLEYLGKEQRSFDQLRKMHVGRLFALAILPLARVTGYTDVILEGLDEESPSKTLERSKDKTGDLLRITSAMMLGMKIHGAYPEGNFITGADVTNALFLKIKEIKKADPDAKIIIYNGAVHNMTQPFDEQMDVSHVLGAYKASELTYAPQARTEWGQRYGAIDLINGDRLLPESHFRFMQDHAAEGAVTAFTHGTDQQTYVIK